MRITPTFSIDYKYEVIFSRNLFSIGNRTFLECILEDGQQTKRKLCFVIDEGVARAHPKLENQIRAYVRSHAAYLELPGEISVVPGGERAKNDLENLIDVMRKVHDEGIDRHSYLIAIGGGAVLDMVGLGAAISHRGIRHIRIPTTVLSQNDSGVGVKNGINFFDKKNFAGAFAPPFVVLNDATFLTTLEARDWRSGISEAIKVALLKDEEFYFWLEEHHDSLASRDLEVMEYMVFRCAQLHTEHIAQNGDPFEQGSSRPLDFGHWAAHKLEQLSDFEIRHGEAVAIGLALDVTYSFMLGKLSQVVLERILLLFTRLGFKIFHPLLLDELGNKINENLPKGLEEFREHLGGKLTIILISAIGSPFEVHKMDTSLIQKAIKFLEKY